MAEQETAGLMPDGIRASGEVLADIVGVPMVYGLEVVYDPAVPPGEFVITTREPSVRERERRRIKQEIARLRAQLIEYGGEL